MAKIRAFAAIRPRADLTSRIAALPYDVYNRAEAKAEVEKEPLSFLKIDRAETQLGDETDTYAPEVYQKAHATFWGMVESGEFVRDEKPGFYLYSLTMQGRTQTGLVACASVDDYLSGVIKKHENTRADKEEDRIRHVDVCNAQTGPIFLAYRRNPRMQELTEKYLKAAPIFDFTCEDGVTHRGWRIADPSDCRAVEEIFAQIGQVYIADGHHRAASAVKVGLKRRAEHPGYDGSEEFNWFLSVLFPDDELKILDYNRVVKDLNGLTPEAFLAAAAEKFTVKESREPVRCARKGMFGLYLGEKWYELTARPEFVKDDPVEGLDVSYLQRELLDPVLGIRDPKTDRRIDFIGGIRGLSELERRVKQDCAAAFALYPTSIGELFAVADAGLLMPPKSTWFEPKLRSGLFIHDLGDPAHPHEHAHGHGHNHTHTHENTKAVLNRLARAIGHLESIRTMVENGRDCSEVLIQLAAVKSAINNTGKVILHDHIQHCLVEAIETGDMETIDELNKAIDQFIK